ncbi:protein PGR-like [Dioscorea cayenensis subsp. rotundata]|uniref:Protein PGR-like n=1 Tax=Dioscorea cayennensis subsp. rotundata TaxID=55577 RepID=A0AB40AR70_DIOCR|nr:protein PGR-like [Dioscorea cayenensis subsp. rotundata]XP_039117443.1 protein PGR-like [Dioscorea cayenensis subsp. rotundata]
MMGSTLLRILVSLVLSLAIAARAYKHKSLNRSGAMMGFVVMAIHIAAGYRFGVLILVFFFTSSKLTKFGQEKKRTIDEDFKEGGQRNWIQVLANSAIATVLVVILVTITGGEDRCLDTKNSALITGLTGGVIGHYACCNGDTWSSEIGMLSKGQPRLITTFKPVKKGTNGAVTIEGLLAAAAAGFVIGLAYTLVGLLTTGCAGDVAWKQLLVVPIATAMGLCGSLIDSLLGATVQFSGYCSLRKKVVSKRAPSVTKISGMNILDNNGVNAASILLTTLLTSVACLYIF